MSRAPRFAAAAVGLALAAALLWLAVPRTVAAFRALPGDHVLDRIQDGRQVTPAQLETLAASRLRALEWVESPRLRTDLGLAELMLAETRERDPALLRRAVASLRAGLARAPARPHAWTRLAYAEILLDGPSKWAARALERALATAPYEPRLLFARLELCLLAWPYLSDAGKTATRAQVLDAWSRSPRRLVALARSTGRPNLIRSALTADLKALVRFNRRYAKPADG